MLVTESIEINASGRRKSAVEKIREALKGLKCQKLKEYKAIYYMMFSARSKCG